MSRRNPRFRYWWIIPCLLVSLAGCSQGARPRPPQPATPVPGPPAVTSTGTAALIITAIAANSPMPLPATPTAVAPPATTVPITAQGSKPGTLAPLPPAFHYEVLLRPANSPNGPDTEIRGVYRAGSWQQSAHTRTASEGDAAPGQEMIAFNGVTYTRPSGDPDWTRWPGTSFDAGYGMTSPFTALRLYAAADQTVRGDTAALPGVPEPTIRTQAAVAGPTVKRLLEAGAAALATGAEERATLIEQLAPLAVPQTVTYWVGASGRIYQAAATLVTADPSGQPSPWMQITWRFWGYDDPAIAVAAPMRYRDAPGPNAAEGAQPLPRATQAGVTDGRLAVSVFASRGVPAENLAVTVYPAGDTRQPIDWRNDAKAWFSLPPGRYDVLVQTDYAQEWLRGLEVKAGAQLAREVTFDFGTLKLAVQRDGKPVAADIVTYPAGNRQNWVDWRSDNPAAIRLRAGVYDVEIAYDDYKAHQTITGLQVKAGETTTQTVNVP